MPRCAEVYAVVPLRLPEQVHILFCCVIHDARFCATGDGRDSIPSQIRPLFYFRTDMSGSAPEENRGGWVSFAEEATF